MSDRGEMGIFEDYMGVQFREGQRAFVEGLLKSDNPHGNSEMGEAWKDGWEYMLTTTQTSLV